MAKRLSRKTRSTQSNRLGYQSLEPRQLLATTSTLDPAIGQLTIHLSEQNDTAIVDTDDGRVTVNGNLDLDSNVSGVQSLSVQDLRTLTVNGSALEGQTLRLLGDFSESNGAGLDSVTISVVDQITVLGNYDIENDFRVSAPDAQQPFQSSIDEQTGRLIVGGSLSVDYGADVLLDAGISAHQFGLVEGNFDGNLFIRSKEIEFGNTIVAEELYLDARFTHQIADTSVSATRLTNLGGVDLRNNKNDLTKSHCFRGCSKFT